MRTNKVYTKSEVASAVNESNYNFFKQTDRSLILNISKKEKHEVIQ